MPTIQAPALIDLTRRIFAAYGVPDGAPASVAAQVARSLVEANLKGHDSHGVIRVIEYVAWLQKGWIVADAQLEVLLDRGYLLTVDGHFGFGQVIGRQATELAIARARQFGLCVLTVRRSAHLGRIGEFMEMGAEAGLACFSFTNTHGGGVLVAPHGGRERRLSANPVAGGAPLPTGPALVMDMATSTIAEGKIKVARAQGASLPSGAIVNGQGEPATSPEEYYADPPGALLPMAGHKGFALSLFAEVFAGALSGAGCSTAGVARIANGWFALFADPTAFSGQDFFAAALGGLAGWVKSSAPMAGHDEVLLPGEPEARSLERCRVEGISIDAETWGKIEEIGRRVGVRAEADPRDAG